MLTDCRQSGMGSMSSAMLDPLAECLMVRLSLSESEPTFTEVAVSSAAKMVAKVAADLEAPLARVLDRGRKPED